MGSGGDVRSPTKNKQKDNITLSMASGPDHKPRFFFLFYVCFCVCVWFLFCLFVFYRWYVPEHIWSSLPSLHQELSYNTWDT